METLPDPDEEWNIYCNIEVELGDDEKLFLSWENTTVFKHLVGDGQYDYIEHHTSDGEIIQFFVDNPQIEGLGEKLEKYRFPYAMSPIVDDKLKSIRDKMGAEEEAKTIEEEAEDLAAEIDRIQDVEGFLSL